MSKILEFVKKKLHSDRFVSLNLKLTIVILLAAGLTVAVLGACSLLQTVVTKNVFQADFMKKKFVELPPHCLRVNICITKYSVKRAISL